MNPKDVVETLDHASAASDRWLFLFAIFIIIAGAGLIIRYLVAQNESQRQSHAKLMEGQTGEYTKMLKEVLNVVFEATAVMRDVKEIMNERKVSRILIAFALLWLSGCAAAGSASNGKWHMANGQSPARASTPAAVVVGRALADVAADVAEVWLRQTYGAGPRVITSQTP